MLSTLPEHTLPPQLDLSRIHILPRGDKLLVMDRISGRWLSMNAEDEACLRLVNTSLDMLDMPVSSTLKQTISALKDACLRHAIGVPNTEKQFNQFNTIIVKLTNACNLACAYCYDYEKIEGAQKLERSMARLAIQQALDLCEDNLMVILHGGEPMLMWDVIQDIVLTGERLAQEKGKHIRFSAQSNMTRLRADIVSFSTQHRIAWGVSLDGDASVHDTFRVDHQGQGSYEQFLA